MHFKQKPLITLLATPSTTPAVLYGIYDVLSMVGTVYEDMVTGVPGEPLLEVKIVSESRRLFRCYGEILVEPHAAIDEIARTDAVVICDRYVHPGSELREEHPKLVSWLLKMYRERSIITSVCSGVTLLAETGLLDGQEASGHWAYQQLYRENYPEVKWRPDSILNFCGEDRRIVTSGGVTAWHNLVLYLISFFCGRQRAIETAKGHLLMPHINGQLPYSSMIRSEAHDDKVIGDIQAWIADKYSESNPVEKMIRRSGLKPRTFARRFRAATGYYPLKYVQELRIESAKQLLESSKLNIDEISAKVGYEDTASFRRLFKRKSGLSPIAYRKKYIGMLSH